MGDSEEVWTLAQGVVDGHPTVVRSKRTNLTRRGP